MIQQDNKLLERARRAWDDAAGMRVRRRRLKAFTYGRQWDDVTLTADGRRLTERQMAVEEGRAPVTNNIIRRMVKSIIGHYRHLRAAESAGDSKETAALSPLSETDARALEELLISGMTIQYIAPGGNVENISPERFIYRRFSRTDASDCTLMGHLADMPLGDVLAGYAGGDIRRAAAIREAFRQQNAVASALPSLREECFDTATLPGTVRVIEVCERGCTECIEVRDNAKGKTEYLPLAAEASLRREAARRRKKGMSPLETSYKVLSRWVRTVMAPSGLVLFSEETQQAPYAVRFYPMIDGEVHSAVEDVIDQQKLVNRLVSTLDRIIASSAKGVLLYPADQLPDGFTWRDIRRIWSNPTGILPYKRTSRTMMPQQVSASGSSSGATELLRMQLELFDEISGATGAFRGRSDTAAGEGMLRAEMENSLISMLDILNSFHEFIRSRDLLIEQSAAIQKD